MEIRNLRADDYENILHLWSGAGLEFSPRGRDSKEHLAKEMHDNPEMFLGMFEQDILIGTVFGTFDGRKGWINRLAVHPEHRNKGLGKTLIEEIEKRLKAKGARIIAVFVYDDNKPSLEVFKRSGYLVFEGVTYLTKREDQDV